MPSGTDPATQPLLGLNFNPAAAATTYNSMSAHEQEASCASALKAWDSMTPHASRDHTESSSFSAPTSSTLQDPMSPNDTSSPQAPSKSLALYLNLIQISLAEYACELQVAQKREGWTKGIIVALLLLSTISNFALAATPLRDHPWAVLFFPALSTLLTATVTLINGFGVNPASSGRRLANIQTAYRRMRLLYESISVEITTTPSEREGWKFPNPLNIPFPPNAAVVVQISALYTAIKEDKAAADALENSAEITAMASRLGTPPGDATSADLEAGRHNAT